MSAFSRILSPVLIVLLVVTSTSLAVARTAPDAAGQMVLCTGSGPVVLLFDENGEPVEAPHYCPECALSLMTAVDTGTHLLVRQDKGCALTFAMPAGQNNDAPHLSALARGPPWV